MKQVAGTLRLDLAQYRELEAFAAFGSDLDAATQKQLTRGARLTEILKQSQYQPLSVEKQIVVIYAGTKGFLDDLELDQINSFESGLMTYIETRDPGILEGIRTEKQLTEELTTSIEQAITEFKKDFLSGLDHGSDS